MVICMCEEHVWMCAECNPNDCPREGTLTEPLFVYAARIKKEKVL